MEKGQRVKIVNTNSFWDNKEGVLEDIQDDRCTVFVDFIPEENKKVRQDFNLENVQELDAMQEALKDKASGKVGELIRDYKNGYGLLQAKDGSKVEVSIDDLEDIGEEEKGNYKLEAITTPSFDDDFNNLSTPEEADWFLSTEGSDSLNILRVNGLDVAIKMHRAKQETISNNNRFKGNVTVFSLFKGEGSSNQFRAYFYRDGNTCVFVRCLLKKRNKNGPKEEKAIQDTIDYALSKK